jgi:hypothetical protein
LRKRDRSNLFVEIDAPILAGWKCAILPRIDMSKPATISIALVTLIVILVAASHARPQNQKIRVCVFTANDDANSVAQSIEAKFNGTLRYETVSDTMKTDLIVFVGCLKLLDNLHSLNDDWVCSSTVQFVSGDLVAVPYDKANSLVIGQPEYVAKSIFERVVSRTGDADLKAKRDFFHSEIQVYCKFFNCS